MVRAAWPFEKILAAFERTDWLIGVRFRELYADEGRRRALDYLSRTVAKAGVT